MLIPHYQNVPIHRDTEVKNYISKIEPIDDINTNNSGLVYNKFQVFVDENGKLETVLLIKSAGDVIDLKCLGAIKLMEFKPLIIKNNPSKYSIFIAYSFSGEDSAYPIINLTITEPIIYNYNGELSDKIYDFESVEEKPKVLIYSEPDYPDLARKAGVSGKVLLEVVIDEKGDAIKTKVIKSLGMLDRSAIEAAKTSKYRPGLIDKKPVKVKMEVPFYFNLKR